MVPLHLHRLPRRNRISIEHRERIVRAFEDQYVVQHFKTRRELISEILDDKYNELSSRPLFSHAFIVNSIECHRQKLRIFEPAQYSGYLSKTR